MEIRSTAVLSGQKITMSDVSIRQYNNLVDQIYIVIPVENDGITLSDYNVFIQTRIKGIANKIALTDITSIGDAIDLTQMVYVWTLTGTDTKRVGTLEFEIQLEHISDPDIPIWQSEISKAITILENIPPVEQSQTTAVGVLSEMYQELQTYNETAGSEASSAASSAEAAGMAATAAGTAASAAATSETNAAASATSANTSATTATAGATAATEQAAIAITAAETATEKATEANTSADNAAASATNANTSATSASSSATNAANSATQAIAAEVAAEAAAETSVKRIKDEGTGLTYQMGIENGLVYFEEVEA